MKKPLLLASIAGSALFLIGALVIIVTYIHQAGQSTATASITEQSSCQKYPAGAQLQACQQGWQALASAVPNKADDSNFNGVLKTACQNPHNFSNVAGATVAQQTAACAYGAGQEFALVNAPPASTKSSSSAAKSASPSHSTPSTSSNSSSKKSSTATKSTPSKATPATSSIAATPTTTPATAPAVVASNTGTPPTQPASSSCNGGGVIVSAVWDGIPGVNNGCIGGPGVNPIYALVSIIITFATGVLGLVMVLMIVIAGLQYVISNGSPDIVRDAKNRIGNVVTGFILFVLMWGLLEFLLPSNVSVFK